MKESAAKREVIKTGPGRNERIELRLAAHYWEAQHARAADRASRWKEKAEDSEKTIKQLKAQLQERDQVIAERDARIAWLERQLFGQKSEKAKPDSAPDDGSDNEEAKKSKKKGKDKDGT